MRPRLIAVLLCCSLLTLGLLFLIRHELGSAKHSESVASALTDRGGTLPVPEAGSLPVALPPRVAGADAAQSTNSVAGNSQPTSADPTQSYVESRVAELTDLGMDNDPASLDTILRELGNRAPEIRRAAREAAVQFGSRDAIPKLLDAASQTDDAQEKADLLQAAEFLKLPSLSETMAQNRTGPPAQPKAPPATSVRPPRPRPW